MQKMQETWVQSLPPWVGKIPWRRKCQSTPVFLPGKFRGQRNLVGYSPWDSQLEFEGKMSLREILSVLNLCLCPVVACFRDEGAGALKPWKLHPWLIIGFRGSERDGALWVLVSDHWVARDGALWVLARDHWVVRDGALWVLFSDHRVVRDAALWGACPQRGHGVVHGGSALHCILVLGESEIWPLTWAIWTRSFGGQISLLGRSYWQDWPWKESCDRMSLYTLSCYITGYGAYLLSANFISSPTVWRCAKNY